MTMRLMQIAGVLQAGFLLFTMPSLFVLPPTYFSELIFITVTQVSIALSTVAARRLFTGDSNPQEIVSDRRFVYAMVGLGVLMVSSIFLERG